jgi:type IV secretory pathway TrbD component
MGGVPRNWAIVNGLLHFMMALFLYAAGFWYLSPAWVVVGAVCHGLLAKACKKDPLTPDTYLRHVKYQKVYPARAHPDAPPAIVRPYRR